ncbi:MAG: hypothetical protein MPJ50_04610 [Pirellulales bacterium]|nr:hypothetical protein [Pirellulales bacterium]
MDPRFVTKSLHAFLDYPVAVSLMVGPLLLGLGSSHSMATWLAISTGVAAFALTLLTDHKLGVIRVLPYSFHLAIDGLVGVVFLITPIAFGFTGIDAVYYWANGGAVLLVVALHKPEPEPCQAPTAA